LYLPVLGHWKIAHQSFGERFRLTELFLVELQVNEEGVTLGERSSAAVIIVDDD
jgi:hypothetical protein